MMGFSYKQIISLCIIGGLMLMENIDAYVLIVALPYIANDLHSTILTLKIAITFYLVGFSVFIPICGWVSDKYGIRNVLLFSILLFICTSALCAQTSSLFFLVVYRFFQGASGAFMIPIGQLLVLKNFEKQLINKAYTFIAYPAMIGPILAPLLGGYTVHFLNWRYIFLINIPIGVVALFATFYAVDNLKSRVKKFNFINSAFLLVGMFLLSMFLDLFLLDINIIIKISLLGCGLMVLVAYFFLEFKSRNPVITYKIFRYPIFNNCFWSTTLLRFSLGGRMFLIVVMLKILYKLNDYQIGKIFMYFALGLIFARTLIGLVENRLGYKKMLTYCNALSTFVTLLFLTVHSVSYWLYFLLVLNGLLTSMQIIILNILSYADIDDKYVGNAVSVVSINKQLSSSIGIVIVGTSLHLANSYLVQEFGVLSFQVAFFIVAVIGFMAQFFIRKLAPDAGANLLQGK